MASPRSRKSRSATGSLITIPAPRWAGIVALLALALTLASFGSLVAPASVAAQETAMPKLGIKPVDSAGAFFAETLEPGEQKELTVELANTGEEDVDALTYAADVYTLVNGGLGVRLSGEPISGATTWIDYPTSAMALPKGEGKEVTFTLSVPDDAQPGEYVTSLVVQNAEAVQSDGDLKVDQILRQAIAIAITVPGDERPTLEIGAATYQRDPLIDSLVIEIRNTGNVHLKPAGTIDIVDAAGTTVFNEAIGMDSVYAGTTTTIQLGIPAPFAPGDYRITVRMADADRGAAAELVEDPLTVEDLQAVEAASLIDGFTVDLVTAADGKTVQLANVTANLVNSGGRIANAQLILRVERDGELVEEYPLLSGAAIESGPSTIQQRYLPLTGWLPGDYTFSLRLESGDPAAGELETLATSAEPVTVTVE